MPALLYDPPEVVPLPPELKRWTSCTHTWTCGDLSFDLTGVDGGLSTSGVFLAPGVRGTKMPPIQHYKSKAASVPGSRWRGSVTDEREVFWPLEVYCNEGSQEWIDFDDLFWSTMRPDRTGVWSVTQPGDGFTEGETRFLTLRYTSGGDEGEDIAPELMGWADYGITLGAEQPYWSGRPISRYWDQSGGLVNYYGGGPVGQSGFGPPYVTTSGRSLATARIDNPGHVPGLVTWTVFGPSTSALLGVGDKQIEVPFSLAAGQWMQLNTARTDRRALFGSGAVLVDGVWVLPQTALAAGVNRTRDLGAGTRFGEVPAGDSVPLSISMVGTGAVQLDMVPLYYTAR